MIEHVKSEWLPQGWTCEPYPRQKDVFVIERARDAGGGMVSLDFGLRVWDGGHQLPRAFPHNVAARRYGGRDWKRTMVGEACGWLEAAMRPQESDRVEREQHHDR